MSYIEKHLLKDEKIIYTTTLNWTNYIIPILVTLPGLFFWTFDNTLGPILSVFGIFLLIVTYLNIRLSEFGVTDKRVIIRVGVLKTTSLETMLHKIEGIHVEQNILGKLTDSGTLIVKGTGGTNNPFSMINKPFEFRIAVNGQIEKLQQTNSN
jgi:uncharacterized membrane protein YdbT with pleckstrin-like domain